MKKLFKSRRDKKFCGVCGGLAEYLSLDPTLVRLIVAVLILCSFFTGMIIYLVAAFIMPFEDEINQ